MTKKNQSRAGRRARKAQQGGSTAQYTELLRSTPPAEADRLLVPPLRQMPESPDANIEVIGHQRGAAAERLLAESTASSSVPPTIGASGLLDLDPQRNLTAWTGARERSALPAVQIAPLLPGGEGKTVHSTYLQSGLAEHSQLVDLDSQRDTRLAPADNSQEEPSGGWPYRLVDARWQGWVTAGNGMYRASYGFKRPGLGEPWPYSRIVAERGPVRPVNHEIENDDSDERLADLWQEAGRKAAASTLVALNRAALQLERLEFGGPHPLTSGREGSWESERLLSLAWNIGEDLAEKPKRYDEAVVAGITGVLTGWVSHPDSYTEVADHLSFLFSQHADRAGGWKAVADQWLQPGARAGHDPDTVQLIVTWLMKSSKDFSRYLNG